MMLARVVGTVTASRNADRVDRGRFLLVQPVDIRDDSPGVPFLALDAVQADRGQLVLVSQGSSCRQLPETRERAVDALIVGIVDELDLPEAPE